MKTRFLEFLFASIVTCSMSLAQASIVVVDFEGLPPAPTSQENLSNQGFSFSPNCHYHLLDGRNGFGSTWLGFDTCGVIGPNPDFLGPPELGLFPAVMWVDYANQPFTLLSLFVMTPFWTVQSSNGGFLDINSLIGGSDLPFMTANFSGPEWTGITWLVFATDAGFPVGFDDLTLRVAEPGTLALFALALAVLSGGRRHRR